jgi:hypothetical protein
MSDEPSVYVSWFPGMMLTRSAGNPSSCSHRDELAAKRKIGQISRDYNMIWRKVTDFVKEAHQDLRPMHRLSLETKIRVPTCPL